MGFWFHENPKDYNFNFIATYNQKLLHYYMLVPQASFVTAAKMHMDFASNFTVLCVFHLANAPWLHNSQISFMSW